MRIKGTKARAIQTFVISMLFVLSFMPFGSVQAVAITEPAYNVAVVDGDPSEWDLTADFYANMYRAGDPDKQVESKLYVRYDCYTETLYVLVLPEPGIYILANDSDTFVKWGTSTLLVNATDTPADGILPDFEWINKVYNSDLGAWVADGWEAAAHVYVGDYTDLNVHTQVYDGGSQTSAVSGRSIPISMVCYDYGDLPEDPSTPAYNITTYAYDGARHIPGNIFLGASIDMEHDGQPNQLATGDDNNGSDDEDGGVRIANPPEYWAMGQGSVEVTITGGKACLNAWMDVWNSTGLNPITNEYTGWVGSDGDFSDIGTGWSENVISNYPLDPGANIIDFTLPMDAATYPVYARFRVSPDIGQDGDCSGQGITGLATSTGEAPGLTGLVIDGEVEDYVFDFNSTAVTLQSFTASPIQAGTTFGLPAILGVGMLGLFFRSRRSH
ncbi:MAG: hypothetical protein JW908_01200 [Anaerolineales bacterium]|nr:hypothetical protein [Anaerolineales bacterium]